jgi:hypothetical protein
VAQLHETQTQLIKTTVNITIHSKQTNLALFNDSVSPVVHGMRQKIVDE